MCVVMGGNILRPIPPTSILAAIVMMVIHGNHGRAWGFAGRDMAWEIATGVVIASAPQEIVR